MSLELLAAASLWWLLLPQASGSAVATCAHCSSVERIESWEGLPSCAATVNNYNLETCPHSYLETPNVWGTRSRPVPSEECSDYPAGLLRDDCNAEETEGTLDITFIAHNYVEANITVSWAALNLDIPPGSMIEIKLVEDPCCNYCGVSRYLCSSDVSQTSMDIPGVKYTEHVTAIQLAVLNGSTPTTIVRTRFVDALEDFRCTNGDIFQYDIKRCPPPSYGRVRSLRAEVLCRDVNGTTVNVSWQAPVQDNLFHASLRYHLTLTPSDAPTQYFTIFPMEAMVSVHIGLSGVASPSYSIGVRPYVDCRGCNGNRRAWENVTTSNSPNSTCITTTPLPSSTSQTSSPTPHPSSSPTPHSFSSLTPHTSSSPTPHPSSSLTLHPSFSPTSSSTTPHPSSSPTSSSTTPHPSSSPTSSSTTPHPSSSPTSSSTTPHPSSSPTSSSTSSLQGPAVLYILLPVVGVLVVLTVLIPVALACCMVRRKPYPAVDDIKLPSTLKASPGRDSPYRLSEVEGGGYIGASTFTSDLQQGTQLERDGSPSTMALSGDDDDMSADEAVPEAEEVIKDFRVLIVYSQSLFEAQRRDILCNLVQRLNEDYCGIKPLCCDTVVMDRQPSIWLQQEVPKADFILCVCTQQTLREWDVTMSTTFGTIKMIVEARICSDEGYSNFAAVLLHASDKKYIPDLLQRNRMFEIDDLDSIVSYITGIPLYVLP